MTIIISSNSEYNTFQNTTLATHLYRSTVLMNARIQTFVGADVSRPPAMYQPPLTVHDILPILFIYMIDPDTHQPAGKALPSYLPHVIPIPVLSS
ncbi:MAG: hypothetical protein ACXWPG_13075 [Ktedonobacteraceae bacterium]